MSGASTAREVAHHCPFCDWTAGPPRALADLRTHLEGYCTVVRAVPWALERPNGVSPPEIARQRKYGWPDFHPEDYCHRCGRRNACWYTDRETWLAATTKWAAETGREGICCPPCFAEMYEEATGKGPIWRFEIHRDADELDLELLAKLASGEGGARTGALARAGLLRWEVTPAGLDALEARPKEKT